MSRPRLAQSLCLFLAVAATVLGASNIELAGPPLSFEANHGQTDASVKFLARGDGYALFLTADTAVFRIHSAAAVSMKLAGANPAAQVSGDAKLPGTVNYFLGNDPADWTTGASTFGKVRYQQVYPGIDLVFYGAANNTARQLEYDFVVAPGADPARIALEFAGADPKLTPDGSLSLTRDGAPLTFGRPTVYQIIAGQRQTVACDFRLTGNRAQFVLGNYDHALPLVIDPVLAYLTYLGGSNMDEVGFTSYGGNPTQGVAVDSSGNVYVAGYTQSTDFPVLNAIQATNTSNGNTGFVAKLNPAGSAIIYSTYIGGSVFGDATETLPYAIAVDSSGNAYITGFTNSPKFPATAGAYQTVCGTLGSNGLSNCPGAQSAFVTKFSPTGGLVYSTFFGHSNETGISIAVDAKGQAYVAGDTVDQCGSSNTIACFPTTPNAVLPGSTFNTTVNTSNSNGGSGFISVFDAAGANLLYSSLFGGNGDQSTGNDHPTYASGVAVDPSGFFYLAGTTGSNQLPVTQGAFQTTYYGNDTPGFSTATRGYVAKFNPVSSGASLFYTTYLGGTDPTQNAYADYVSGIAVDAAGNAYISGNASYDFPATAGSANSTPCPSDSDCLNRGFLAKLNPAGSTLLWATFVGNEANPDQSVTDTISPPQLDAQGNVYIGGIAGTGLDYPLVNPLQPQNEFGGVYATMFDPTGSTILFSTIIYNPAQNSGIFNSGVAVDSSANLYVAGYTSTPGLPTTAGAFQPAVKGNTDAFIAKIQTTAPLPAIAPNGVVSGASFQTGIVPSSWVTIYGTNLSTVSDLWTIENGQFPTQLDGVSVSIGGQPAYVEFVSPGQINVLAPNIAAGPVQVTVTNSMGTSQPVSATAALAGPAFFLWANTYAVATYTDYTYAAKNGAIAGVATVPAAPGDVLILWGTGFGPTNPAATPGQEVPPSGLYPTANPVTVSIGNIDAIVYGSVLSPGFAGLYQIAVQVPTSAPNGDLPIIATVNGVSSPATTLLTVQQ